MGYTGRCLCGRVRYELEGELAPLANCHCRYCRRAHGAAFVTVSYVPRARFRFTAGEELVRSFAGTTGARHFCGECGTRLFAVPAEHPDHLSLAVAALDEAPPAGPVLHVNVGSKAPWWEIQDDLPRFEALPPAAGEAEDHGDQEEG